MREVPDCLSRRYRAVDDLIQELSSVMSRGARDPMTPSTEDPGIKLMCEFWNILKEEPDLNLPQAVQQRMDLNSASSSYFRPKHVACYMASSAKKIDDKKMEALNKIKRICCKHSNDNTDEKAKGCPSKASSSTSSAAPPLNKVLCNLKEAASFDKKCNAKISELMATQKGLQAQIQHLEQREKDGIALLKEADCMWSCMEESYKHKVAESLQRQKSLLKQLKDAEANNMKWRKNRKDLEFQINNINKCHNEITERINQKSSDIKCIDMEIETFKKRIENNKSDLETSKKSVLSRKQASDNKIASIASEVSKLEKKLKEEQKFKKDKEIEGTNYIKEAREDLQKLCKVLLQKRLENEDFRAEREALLLEIELLKQTCDQCKDKCINKEQTIQDEIKRIEKEIEEFKVKCIQCHECTDTIDVRKLCTDCPRCIQDRDCHLDGDHCSPDYNMDCVCMTVKEKFLDNVFDNMYTVLERQIKSGAGKAVADAVLNCLKKSRNGKLNEETRKILQDFILTTVKKNLNLTIVGGAVKTRCEMDPETYEQLMLCLKQVKVTKPPKADKGTDSKKDPCHRWGGTSECNCPKGPKSCVCTRKAPAPPDDPNPCPEPPEDKENAGEVIQCPHRESTSCGPDCAMHAVPSSVGTDVAAWRQNPCQGPTCQFKNMRAAQCVLGPEALSSLSSSRAFVSTTPYVPGSSILADQITCKCGSLPTTPCACHGDAKQLKVGTNNQCDQNICKLVENSKISEKHDKAVLYRQNILDHSDDSKYAENKAEKPFDTQSIERLKKCIAGDVLKVTLESGVGLLDQTPMISKSSSGNLEMAINEQLFELINRRTKEDPNLNVFLIKTNSGHIMVDFQLGESTTAKGKKVLINRTASDSLLLQVNDKVIGKPSFSHKTRKPCATCCGKNLTLTKDDITQFLLENKSKSICHKQNNDMIPDIKIILENNNKDISGNLIRTSSGHVAIVVKNISEVSKAALETKEQQHFEIKKYPTTAVNTCEHKQSDQERKSANYILSKNNNGYIKTGNKYFPVKLKGILCPYIVESLMVIKTTNSGNYEIAFDKEFEKIFKEIIKEYEGVDKESYVKLKTDCDQCIIDFDGNEDHRCFKVQKALLVKSSSGTIKLLVKNSDYENLKRFSTSKSIMTRKVLEDIFNNLSSNDTIHKNKQRKPGAMRTNSSSDSNVYQKAKFDFLNQQNLLTEPPAVLQKSKSGQFEIILNKESKKDFVNNLKKYLSSNSKVSVPVKRSKSGQITINLGHNAHKKDEYGSLKITPSGNIYVLVDESKFSTERKPSLMVNQIEIQEKPSQYIYQIKNPANQAVSTTCNAKSNDSSCDTSKCVCRSISYKSRKWFIEKDDSIEKFKSEECLKQGIHFVNNFVSCDNNKQNGKCLNTFDTDNKSPHIVIKPCGCRPVLENCPNKGIYRFVQSVCPYHIDRYENLSNELLEISGLCSRGRTKILGDAGFYVETNSLNLLKREQKKETTWDSLEYLPPQLPPFLREYTL